jgi:hypothetical protein
MADLPEDLIGVKAATALIPSPVPGAKTHLSTIYSWIRKGKLRCWKRDRYRLVSRAELLALLEPQPLPVGARAVETSADERRRVSAETKRGLERAGI